jgi:hypothetical protein
LNMFFFLSFRVCFVTSFSLFHFIPMEPQVITLRYLLATFFVGSLSTQTTFYSPFSAFTSCRCQIRCCPLIHKHRKHRLLMQQYSVYHLSALLRVLSGAFLALPNQTGCKRASPLGPVIVHPNHLMCQD